MKIKILFCVTSLLLVSYFIIKTMHLNEKQTNKDQFACGNLWLSRYTIMM